MSRPIKHPFRLVSGVAVAALLVLTGCTSNSPDSDSSGDGDGDTKAVSANDDPGDSVTIGFSVGKQKIQVKKFKAISAL